MWCRCGVDTHRASDSSECLCTSDAQDWLFPLHEKLLLAVYDELAEDSKGFRQYEEFTIGRADQRAARRANDAGADDDDDDDTFDDADVVLPDQDRIHHNVASVHPATVKFYEQIMQELEDTETGTGDASSGGRPPYSQWQSMWVEPPDPMIVVPFSKTAWNVQRICFCDPTAYYHRIGVGLERPCARGGWGHARFVRVQRQGKFSKPRLIKGRGVDSGLCSVEMHCSECRRERQRLKKRRAAVKSQLGAQSDAAVALENELKNCSYGFSSIHPQYLAFLAARYPFMLAAIPFSTSHKAAVTHDVILECGRAMRTSQSSCDIEAQYDELRALALTKKHLSFASVQRCVLQHAQRRARLAGEVAPSINDQWVELDDDTGVSRISDNYVTSIQLSEFKGIETYFNQWHEQHVPRGKLVHVDCHGKRDNAIRLDGTKDLMWTYTEMNGLGHKTLSVKVNSTSMNDPSLIAAYDQRARADARWNLERVRRGGVPIFPGHLRTK